MNKKRLAKGLTAAALVGVLAIGSTLAYLSATTGTRSNAFTGANNITGQTTEKIWDSEKAEHYQPGDVLNKTPNVEINAGSEVAKVALSVDYYGNVESFTDNKDGSVKDIVGTKMSQTEFERYAKVNDYNVGAANTQWTKIAESAKGAELYMYNSDIDATKAKEPVPATNLFNKVTVNAKLRTISEKEIENTKVYSFNDLNGNGILDDGESKIEPPLTDISVVTKDITETTYVDGNGNLLVLQSLPTFIIDVKGFAVQAKIETEGTTPADVLIELANKDRAADDQFTVIN